MNQDRPNLRNKVEDFLTSLKTEFISDMSKYEQFLKICSSRKRALDSVTDDKWISTWKQMFDENLFEHVDCSEQRLRHKARFSKRDKNVMADYIFLNEFDVPTILLKMFRLIGDKEVLINKLKYFFMPHYDHEWRKLYKKHVIKKTD